VVPTRNRERLLMRALESLLAQHAGRVRYEVIVVDNGSTDGTRALVDSFAARGRARVRHVHEPRPGASQARNTGIAAARAPIVAFLDDDVEADPTWVATIAHTLQTHPDIDCVGGSIAPRWSTAPPRWLSSSFWGAVALQDGKGDSPYIDRENASSCLMTANFACRRDALDGVGGFSAEYLRDEDRELQLRLWSAGKRGMYVAAMAATTEVPPERLTKRYHRRFYIQTGASHARMRYLDRIDARGRLLPGAQTGATFFGTPGFIYRRLLVHAAALVASAVTMDRGRSFFHETRLLYFASYVWSRYRETRIPPWAAPAQLLRFGFALLRNRLRQA
jgi:glycosyltransferase involved in cell wall biosynthesis